MRYVSLLLYRALSKGQLYWFYVWFLFYIFILFLYPFSFLNIYFLLFPYFQLFRTSHISLVADYIIAQQKKGVNKVRGKRGEVKGDVAYESWLGVKTVKTNYISHTHTHTLYKHTHFFFHTHTHSLSLSIYHNRRS